VPPLFLSALLPAVLAVCLSTAAQAQTGQTPISLAAHGNEVPLSMEEAVALALQKSYRVNRSARSTEMAQMRLDASRAQFRPRFDTSLNFNESLRVAFYENPYRKGKTDPYATSQVSLSAFVSMPIDLSGSLGRQEQQASLSLESANINADQATIDIHADVRSAYAGALRDQGAVDADEALVAELRAMIERARSRRPAAVPFLEVELANAEQLLSISRSEALIGQNTLKQQLRLPADTVLRLTSSLNPAIPQVDPAGLLDIALTRRADVRDAQLRLQQAELSLVQSRDSRRPSAQLYGFWNQSYSGANPGQLSSNSSRSASLMFNVNVPLVYWDGGGMDRAERMALLSLEQVRDDMEEQQARIASELRSLTINLTQAQRRLASLPSPRFALESLRQAEEAVLSSADWQGQMAQVTNARNTWRLTNTAAMEALAGYYSAYFRLQRALGER
jgi:outer membrane protein TolC